MSQAFTTSEARAVAGQLWRPQVMDVVRGATFISVLLLAWISLRPFIDLSDSSDLTTGNEALTYVAFGCFAVLMVGLAMRDHMQGLLTLLSPGYILLGAWIVATVVLSLDPATSVRRFALIVSVIAVAATLLLLPKTRTN